MKRISDRLSVLAIGTALSMAAYAGGDKADKMDSNNDGMVSASEHAAGASTMFAEIDADRNGSVTATEMDAHWQAKGKSKKSGEMSSAEKIREVDGDGDGALTAAEHAAGAQKKFAEMDADKDGSLAKAEMDAGHRAMTK
jgi:Ca2+-binding EF-hand superfamily protein